MSAYSLDLSLGLDLSLIPYSGSIYREEPMLCREISVILRHKTEYLTLGRLDQKVCLFFLCFDWFCYFNENIGILYMILYTGASF